MKTLFTIRKGYFASWLQVFLFVISLAGVNSENAFGGPRRTCRNIFEDLPGDYLEINMPGEGLHARRLVAEIDGFEIPFAVILPKGYSPKKKWPVMVFLHGLLESGDDLNGPIYNGGLLSHVFEDPENFPGIILIPQCPWDVPNDVQHRWYSSMDPNDGNAPRVSDLVMQAVDTTVESFGGDNRKVYLTGVSMGAYGVWGIASQFPDRFAALLPISGEPAIEDVAHQIPDVPIWIIHGEYDDVISVDRARETMDQLWHSGHHRAHYTEYPQASHVEAWEWGYKHEDILRWLFSQKRK